MFVNISHQDTALNAVRGLQEANVVRIFRLSLRVFVTLTAILYAALAHSAPTETPEANPPKTQAPLVALASSFRSVWPILMEAYTKDLDNHPPKASFASSGLLSTQILRGAPFELFLSADERSVARLLDAEKTQSDPMALAAGTISLVTLPATSSQLSAAESLASIQALMAMGKPVKIAIPNPRHAPYGIAAQQALTTAGLWPMPRGALLNAENASQALQYALSGAASMAIVPTTLVTQVSFDINVTLIDPGSYEPVIHHLAILAPAGDNARKLSDWLVTPKAVNIMSEFGLSPLEK